MKKYIITTLATIGIVGLIIALFVFLPRLYYKMYEPMVEKTIERVLQEKGLTN